MPQRSGFTVVELMIASAIIALLCAIAVPSMFKARERGQAAKLVAELRTTRDGAEMYAQEHAGYAQSYFSSPQWLPPDMSLYLGKNNTWSASPSCGGYWLWINLGVPVGGWDGNAYIYHYSCGLSVEQVTAIDSLLDDGNPSTGYIRYWGGAGGSGLIYGLP